MVAVATGSLAAAQEGATNAPARSVFNQPTNPNEGRDPFFPNSTRPYQDFIPRHTAAVDTSALTIRGFSVISGHRYVIINNHTFGEGDEGDVITPAGRIHVRCLTLGTDSVLVETDGSRHLLRFTDQQ